MTSLPPDGPADRRKNLLLRALIDEMMGQLRELQRHSGPWPPEERAKLEQDLERIMAQVRSQSFTGKPPTP